MRTLTLASFVVLAALDAFAQEKPGSPTEPQKLSLPATADETTFKLPVQVPDYLNEKDGWGVTQTREGTIPVKAASKSGYWTLTLYAKARLTTYTQKAGGLSVLVLAIQTGGDTFKDVSAVYGYETGALQFALWDGSRWHLSKSAIGENDQPTLENNVMLFPDRLDETRRTVMLIARTQTAAGLKEVSYQLN